MTFDQKKQKPQHGQGGTNGSLDVMDMSKTVPQIDDLLADIDSLLDPVVQRNSESEHCRC